MLLIGNFQGHKVGISQEKPIHQNLPKGTWSNS
jgi:hypothetical protein